MNKESPTGVPREMLITGAKFLFLHGNYENMKELLQNLLLEEKLIKKFRGDFHWGHYQKYFQFCIINNKYLLSSFTRATKKKSEKTIYHWKK